MSNKQTSKGPQSSTSETKTQPVATPQSDAASAVPAEVVAAPPVTPDAAVPTDTGLTVVTPKKEDVSIDVLIERHPGTLVHYSAQLPHLKEKLIRTKRPTADDLERAVGKLTKDERIQFEELMARLNPEKEGVVAASDRIQTRTIKLYQGTGNDTSRPGNCPPGGYYVKGGDTLTVTPDLAQEREMPTSFQAAVIGYYNGRSYFPQKDSKGNNIVPPGVPQDTVIICNSHDRVHGKRYHACESCAYRPRNDADRTCKDQVDLFLMPPDMSGIFQLTLSSTSLPTGATPIRQQLDAWRVPYECFFNFSSEPKTRGDQKWFAARASVAKTKAAPGGLRTSEGFRALASYFARMIMCEWYYRNLADSYSADTGHGADKAGPAGDANEALAVARAEAATDNSNNI